MANNILLKLSTEDFKRLDLMKCRYEFRTKQDYTWEEFIMIMRDKFERTSK